MVVDFRASERGINTAWNEIEYFLFCRNCLENNFKALIVWKGISYDFCI